MISPIARVRLKLSSVNQLTLEEELKFWSKVNISGSIQPHMPHLGPCWEWEGYIQSNGYGSMYFRGQNHGVHRLAAIIKFGEPIPDNAVVMHLCDNPRCVRHIKVGSYTQNLEDCKTKGRYRKPVIQRVKGDPSHPMRNMSPEMRAEYSVRMSKFAKTQAGSNHPNSILNEDIVREIRIRVANGEPQTSLASHFGVSLPTINAVVKRRNWGHVT